MSELAIAKCYIEEYENDEAKLSARLREKTTGRKVDLSFAVSADRQDFLRFLGAAKANRALMPDVFSRNGAQDAIIVSGELDFDAPDEIRFIYNDSLSYSVA